MPLEPGPITAPAIRTQFQIECTQPIVLREARPLTLEELALAPAPRASVTQALLADDGTPTADFARDLSPRAPIDSGARRVTSKYIRARHHAIARSIVAGLSDQEIISAHKTSAANLTILRQSPAFQDLLSVYLEGALEETLNMRARIMAAASDALDELHARIVEEDGPAIPTATLLKATTDLLDRAGHSPINRLHVKQERGLSPSTIEALKAELAPAPCIVVEAPAAAGAGAEPEVEE